MNDMMFESKSLDHLKYPQDFINKIICGDCLKLINKLPERSIDGVITDPPYPSNIKKTF